MAEAFHKSGFMILRLGKNKVKSLLNFTVNCIDYQVRMVACLK